MLEKAINKNYLIFIFFVLSFLIYARTINYGFVWDDERIHLSANKQLMEGDIKSFWEQPYSGMYIPVTYSTWIIIKNIFEDNYQLSPGVFHLLNVITHSINCILLFRLLLILFKDQRQAFLGSLIFLAHPMQVESVAWISEFRGLYSSMFSFLALLTMFRYMEKEKVFSSFSFLLSKHFFLSTAFFVSALLAKPSAIVLPFVAGILVWCFYNKKFVPVVKSLLVWGVLIVPIIVITRHSQAQELISGNSSILQKLWIAGDSLFFYFQKLLIPYPLVACYGYTPTFILNEKLIYFSTAICILLFVILFIKRKSIPVLFSAFAIIFICLLPVLGLIPFEYQKHSNVADHYIYFAMLGFVLLVPAILIYLKKIKYSDYVVVFVLLLYLFLNIKQTATWKNEFTVWDHTISHYQNSPNVFYNRGVEYSKMRKFPEAIGDYSQCLLLQNNYLDALFNRANAYENLNDLNSAFIDYNTYLTIDSTDGAVYYKRANLFYKTGDIKSALKDIKQAEQFSFPVSAKFKEKLRQEIEKKSEAL